jgi:hypothetical protein
MNNSTLGIGIPEMESIDIKAVVAEVLAFWLGFKSMLGK